MVPSTATVGLGWTAAAGAPDGKYHTIKLATKRPQMDRRCPRRIFRDMKRFAIVGTTTFPVIVALILPVSQASAQDTRNVVEPTIPQTCAVLVAALSRRGGTLAESDESKLDTARIQAALNGCEAGRAVELKPSADHDAFVSGPLQLRNGVTLLIDSGVTLFASRNPRDFDARPGACGIVSTGGGGCLPLIGGTRIKDAGVMGDGVIDGRGSETMIGQNITWWDLAEQARAGGSQNNPRLVVLSGCNNFTMYRITLQNSPNFHVTFGSGDGFTVWGVKIHSPKNARNTDGIDPANSTNVTITKSWIDTGDDNIAIKAGAGLPTTHMTISHNHFYSGHGMSIGSETNGGASAIWVSDLSIDGADNGIRIKSNSTRGGLVHDIVYEDVCMRNTKNPIYMDTHYTATVGTTQGLIPQFEDITLRNVRIVGEGKITLDGYDAERRLGMTLDNVAADNPEAVRVSGSHVSLQLGPGPVNIPITGDDIAVKGITGQGNPNSCAGKFVDFPVP
jgi:polygalacturonase